MLLTISGYPTITLPIGVDKDGMPVGLTLQQTAWAEGTLIKWASAIEDVMNDLVGGRPLPAYRDHMAKNVPIGRKHIAKLS
jgi:amidase